MSVNKRNEFEKTKYINNLNILKKRYKQRTRDNFLNAFGNFYCNCEMKMNIPSKNNLLKTCNHNTAMTTKHELVTNITNVFNWLDSKMNYIIDSPTANQQKNATNNNYVKIGQHLSNSSLYNQIPDPNEDNIQLKSMNSNENGFIHNTVHSNTVEITYNDPSKTVLKENVSLNKSNMLEEFDNKHIEVYNINKKMCTSHKQKVNIINNETSPKVISPNHDITECLTNGPEVVINKTCNIVQNMHNTRGNIDLNDCSQNKDKKDSIVFGEICDSTQIGAESIKNTITINEVETISTISGRNSRFVKKQLNKKIKPNKTLAKQLLKSEFTRTRSNSVIDSEHISNKNAISENLINDTSGVDTISTQVENIYSNECSKNKVSNVMKMSDLKEISSESKTHNTVNNEEKNNHIQNNFDIINGKNTTSNLCLDTSSIESGCDSNLVKKKINEQFKLNKTSKKQLNSTFTRKRSNSVIDSEHISKKIKIKESSINHTIQINDIKDMNKSKPFNNINNLKEKDNDFYTEPINISDNSTKKTLITPKLDFLTNKKKNMLKKIKVDTKNNVSLTNDIVDTEVMNLQLEKTSKQNDLEKNSSVKTSNDSTKKSSKNMYSKNSKGESKIHDDDACAKVDTKNNVSLTNDIVDTEVMNLQLEKTSKQNDLEKNFSVKTSNDSTKKCSKNMYSKNSKGESKIHDACAKVNTKNNVSLTNKIVDTEVMNFQLKKTSKQNDLEKNSSVKASNDSTKKSIKNMYSKNSKGETKMHAACAKGNIDLVISLLLDGFNPNVKDNAGWTPLHEAVKAGHLSVVKELINYGAYINVPGFEYESPLHTAIKYDQFDIAILLLQNGADTQCINIYGNNAQSLNIKKWPVLMKNKILSTSIETKHNYEINQIVLFLNKVSLDNAVISKFCNQFNVKHIKNEKQFVQVTHIIVPKTKNNTCGVNLECLIAIANGLFIVNENWIFDSLEHNKLMECKNYEVSGTTSFVDCNGPKISRINTQKLYPKLFDGISIHISGNIGWEQFSIEHLKKLVLEFGAKILKRMPNPEDCSNNIIPYHCRNNKQMYHVSNIILYTEDSKRLIKYNMEHLKVFHISWFIEVIQKYSFIK